MKTTVERIDETTVKLSVIVEASRVEEVIDAAARELARDVKIPGFRPGRVPRKVLESRLGKDALVSEAVRESLPTFYADALEAENLAVVGSPEFDVETFEPGKDAAFSATVEVRPDVTVPDYEGMQIPHPEWEPTEEDVQGELDALRERFAELETVSRPARPGDYAIVTVTGSRHGQKVEEASGEDVLYEVGDPEQTDAELDRQIVGVSAGAILKFNDTLGPDYGELAGEELAFTVIVKDIKVKRLPELDDDFALTASEFDTLEDLREAVRTQLARQKLAAARADLRGKVVEHVSELVEVALPRSLVDYELRFRISQIVRQAESAGVPLEQFLQAAGTSGEELQARLEDEARRTVKAQLVVDAVGRDAGISVTQEDLGAEVARQALRLGQPPEEIARFMTHPERIGALVADAFRRKTIDHILEHVQVLGGPPADIDAQLEALATSPEQVEGSTTAAVLEASEPADAEAPAAE